ncbi:MAG: hypothetical protein ACYCST_13980 [Acidimicrobiales bacterium]
MTRDATRCIGAGRLPVAAAAMVPPTNRPIATTTGLTLPRRMRERYFFGALLLRTIEAIAATVSRSFS